MQNNQRSLLHLHYNPAFPLLSVKDCSYPVCSSNSPKNKGGLMKRKKDLFKASFEEVEELPVASNHHFTMSRYARALIVKKEMGKEIQ